MVKRKVKRLFLFATVLLTVTGGAAAGIILLMLADLPAVKALEEYRPSQVSRVYADDGTVIGEFYLERRILIPMTDIPKHLKQAAIAVEDARFYSHHGVDFWGILRAAYRNYKTGEIVEGGSTITQQIAKLLFLTPERTLTRKLKEAALAIQIEKHYTKDQILYFWLNQAYMGSGAYGVEAAAQTYYGKSAKNLTLAEAAMIAGLPKSPSTYSPLRHPERARERRRHVLERMRDLGYIKQPEITVALQSPLATRHSRYVVNKAPYFVEYVRLKIEERYGPATYTGGLHIHTTLNSEMQALAERALAKGLAELTKRTQGIRKHDPTPVQGAVLTLEQGTGHIKAMIGGTDFWESQFNRAWQALRQPGSAFKPFIYVTALDKGYSPAHTIVDGPVVYPGGTKGKLWKPENYDRTHKGPVTLRYALAHSINTVAVKLLAQLGIPAVTEQTQALGVRSPLQPYLPMALGASDLTLMEISSAYGVFGNQGVWVEPIAVLRVTDDLGRVIEEFTPQTREVLRPEVAYVMTQMLMEVIERGTGVRAKEIKRPLAGKTGTANDFRNAWFIAYTPRLTTGVWVGYDDHRPIGHKETGSRAALPIWLEYMKAYYRQRPPEEFPIPDGVVFLPVDPSTGRPLPPGSKGGAKQAFVPGTEPKWSKPAEQDEEKPLPDSPPAPPAREARAATPPR
jgi:penicillin-binding protein 1A